MQFIYKHVLNKAWTRVDIVKPPQSKVLPDILTVKEIEWLINRTRKKRYQTFILTAYSIGLRLGETLNLRASDIDSEGMKVHIRQGKGKKDRFVTLPEASLVGLRRYWTTHRHPGLLFRTGKAPTARHTATVAMDRCGLEVAPRYRQRLRTAPTRDRANLVEAGGQSASHPA